MLWKMNAVRNSAQHDDADKSNTSAPFGDTCVQLGCSSVPVNL